MYQPAMFFFMRLLLIQYDFPSMGWIGSNKFRTIFRRTYSASNFCTIATSGLGMLTATQQRCGVLVEIFTVDDGHNFSRSTMIIIDQKMTPLLSENDPLFIRKLPPVGPTSFFWSPPGLLAQPANRESDLHSECDFQQISRTQCKRWAPSVSISSPIFKHSN